MIKMEKALNFWLEDLNRKSVPTDSNLICEKARSLYEHFNVDGVGEGTSTGSKFKASKGWFDHFKRRFSLKMFKLASKSASADIVGAEEYKKKHFLK